MADKSPLTWGLHSNKQTTFLVIKLRRCQRLVPWIPSSSAEALVQSFGGVLLATRYCIRAVGTARTTERQYSAIKSYRISIPNQPPSEYTILSKFLKHYLSQPLYPLYGTITVPFVMWLMKCTRMLIKAELLRLSLCFKKKKSKIISQCQMF